MVTSVGSRYASQGNLGGYFAGYQEKAAGQEGHSVGYGIRESRVRWAGVWRFWDRYWRCPGGQSTWFVCGLG